MAAKKSKWPPKTVKPNITGLIIDLQSRVICQNDRCLNKLYNLTTICNFNNFNMVAKIQNGRQKS